MITSSMNQKKKNNNKEMEDSLQGSLGLSSQ